MVRWCSIGNTTCGRFRITAVAATRILRIGGIEFDAFQCVKRNRRPPITSNLCARSARLERGPVLHRIISAGSTAACSIGCRSGCRGGSSIIATRAPSELARSVVEQSRRIHRSNGTNGIFPYAEGRSRLECGACTDCCTAVGLCRQNDDVGCRARRRRAQTTDDVFVCCLK